MAEAHPVKLSLRTELQNKEFRAAFFDGLARTNLAAGLVILREKRGLTQAQLAAKTGTTQSGVARAESQSYHAVSLSTAIKLALAMDGMIEITVKPYEDWRP